MKQMCGAFVEKMIKFTTFIDIYNNGVSYLMEYLYDLFCACFFKSIFLNAYHADLQTHTQLELRVFINSRKLQVICEWQKIRDCSFVMEAWRQGRAERNSTELTNVSKLQLGKIIIKY